MPATANISDVGKTDFAMIRYNIRKYIIEHSVDFLCDLTGLKYGYIALLPITLCAIGVIAEGFKLENLHYTLLIIGTYVVLILLPYNQGMRYMYNILPLIVMYLFYGVLQVSRWISRMLKTPALKRWSRRAALAMIVLLCLNACKAIVIHDCQNLYNKRISQNNLVYSEDVVEMYGAIKTFTPEDCTIAFLKPRALYLNTGRKAFNHNVNGHELMDADYYLFSSGLADTQEKQLLQQYIDQLEIIHSTQGMTLYQIKKTGDL